MRKCTRQEWVALACMASLLCALPARAQEYPNKPVQLLVHLAAGTVSDLVFRAVANQMSKTLRVPVIVENRPGAGGMIVYEQVVKNTPADGYVMVSSTNSNLSLPVFVKDLRIDPVKDIGPVAIMAEGTLSITSPVAAPWNSMAEMVAYARANPGKLNWGTSGAASVANLNMEAVVQKDGLKITNIPYQGGNNLARLALYANDIQLLVQTESETLQDTRSGKVKALAISGDRRRPAFPNVPTFTEAGYPQLVGVWWALNVKAGTPRPVMERLNAAATFAVQQPEVKDFFDKNGVYAVEMSVDAAAKKVEEVARSYTEIAAKSGIKPQ
ncbi:MAG: tripartite tricarboxylate transporter substrate binding protein [Betaproteobacteria bacterium]|nr:tripartite tricarboxylate transporter substrate binding protein [Betaproteobacteria bacterium]